MAYEAPGVRVHQEFSTTATGGSPPLRAWIIGNAAITHSLENNRAVLGDFENIERTYNYPNRQAGSALDSDSVHVWAEDAVWEYAAIPAVESPLEDSDAQFVYNVEGTPNLLQFHNMNIATNGNYMRDSIFGVRDVQIGDIVRLRAYASAIPGIQECTDVSFTTTVADLAVVLEGGNVGTAIRTGYRNTPTTTFPEASALTEADNSEYTGNLAEEQYTVTVKAGSYTVASASGQDNYPATWTPLTASTPIPIGIYGVRGQLSDISDAVYTVKVTSKAFTQENPSQITNSLFNATVALTLSGTYNPLTHYSPTDTIVIRVTGKTNSAACKNVELSISGLHSGLFISQAVLSNDTWTFPVTADEGLKASFADSDYENISVGDTWAYNVYGAYAPASLVASGTYTHDVDDTYIIRCTHSGTVGDPSNPPKVTVTTAMGEDYLADVSLASNVIQTRYGLVLTFSEEQMLSGESYAVQVTSKRNGPVRGVLLKDSLPLELRSISGIVALDTQLCIASTEEIPATSVTRDNVSETISLPAAISKTLETTGSSCQLVSGKLLVTYTEWSRIGEKALNVVSSMDDLDLVPGSLSPDNPVKYGVYKALSVANGMEVAWTPVVGNTLEAWKEALSAGDESKDVYMVVPMSQDEVVHNAVLGLVTDNSSPEVGAWKRCFLSKACPSEELRVGATNSTDGKPVMGTLDGNHNVTITSRGNNNKSNADLSLVEPGDLLRIYTTPEVYTNYTIQSVRGDAIILQELGTQTFIPEKIEVWHTLTQADAVKYITDKAASIRNRRATLVWPDQVSEGDVTVPGYYLCAVIAGLTSGLEPHQGLTHYAITGFDGYSRSVPMFNEASIKQLAAKGVLVVRKDRNGTPVIFHSLTTEQDNLNYTEEMVTRNVDQLSFEIATAVNDYIGVYNVNDTTIDRVATTIRYICDACVTPTNTILGGRLIDYEITSVAQDVLLKDHIVVQLNIEVPYALNVLSVYILV